MGALKSKACARGHVWTAESTGYRKSGPQAGQRYCRICKAEFAREARARRKKEKKNGSGNAAA